jgi:hypothetical protein
MGHQIFRNQEYGGNDYPKIPIRGIPTQSGLLIEEGSEPSDQSIKISESRVGRTEVIRIGNSRYAKSRRSRKV